MTSEIDHSNELSKSDDDGSPSPERSLRYAAAFLGVAEGMIIAAKLTGNDPSFYIGITFLTIGIGYIGMTYNKLRHS